MAEELGLPQHVLRFWESKFPQIRPLKRGGGRRYYRPEDIALLRAIQGLLYESGYTIKGVQKLIRTNGAKALVSDGEAVTAPMPESTPPEAPPAVVAGVGDDTVRDALKALIQDLENIRNLLAEDD